MDTAMPARPRASRAEQRAALDTARARLQDNDIDGYWAALEQQDPYDGLARNAAAHHGELGRTANARLERVTSATRGRPLDEAGGLQLGRPSGRESGWQYGTNVDAPV